MTTESSPAPAPNPAPGAFDRRFLIQLAVTLIGGSLMGALVTLGVQEWRSRVPTIHHSIDTSGVFSGAGPNLKANVTITENDKSFEFPHLSLVKIKIANKTRQDYAKFRFGVTLPPGNEVIRSDTESKDRMHYLFTTFTPSPETPVSDLDYTAEPLNRGDEYTLTLYVKSSVGSVDGDKIKLATPESVKWAALGDADSRSTIYSSIISSLVLFVLLVIAWLWSSYSTFQDKQRKELREYKTDETLLAILARLEADSREKHKAESNLPLRE